MNVPDSLKAADDDVLVRHLEYDDESLIVVDFGSSVGDGASVDVVGSTVIVATTDRQLEFELPTGASDVTVRHGVVTLEGDERE